MEKRVGNKKRARRHSAEFKASAVEQRKRCDNIVALSRELKVHGRMRYRWKTAARGGVGSRNRAAENRSGRPGAGAGFFQRCRRSQNGIRRLAWSIIPTAGFKYACAEYVAVLARH